MTGRPKIFIRRRLATIRFGGHLSRYVARSLPLGVYSRPSGPVPYVTRGTLGVRGREGLLEKSRVTCSPPLRMSG